MNEARLQTIFKNYIEKFDYMNAPDPGPDEKYKWEIACDFRRQMDEIILAPAAEMKDRMKRVVDEASNLLQNQYELPGAALDYYKAAAEGGDALAHCNVGWLYESGELGEPDLEEAIRWYKYGAFGGDEYCKENLKRLGIPIPDNHVII